MEEAGMEVDMEEVMEEVTDMEEVTEGTDMEEGTEATIEACTAAVAAGVGGTGFPISTMSSKWAPPRQANAT